MDRIFLTWVPFSSRSHLLAQAFNARPYYVTYLSKKTVLCTALRYCLASFHTLYILFRTRPRLIFLMNQPVFLPMIVYCYSKWTSCHYILDSHSGLFNKRVWKNFVPVMKRIYQNCLLNIAHNTHDAERYRSWGAKTTILGTEVYPYESYPIRRLETSNNVVVIGKFASDEPIEEIVSAATDVKNVHFYFTGPIERAKRRIDTKSLPNNITLTGFLPRDEFIALVKAANVALVLVTTDNTMQMAAWEAMSCNTPVILSDWKLLRSTFPKGAVFVKNKRDSIREGIEKFFENRKTLKREIQQLKEEKSMLWHSEIKSVENILKSCA